MLTVLFHPVISPHLIFSRLMKPHNSIEKIFALVFIVLWASSSTPEWKLQSCLRPVAHLSHHTATSPANKFLAQQQVSDIWFMLQSVTHTATLWKPLQSPMTAPLFMGFALIPLYCCQARQNGQLSCSEMDITLSSLLSWVSQAQLHF